MTMRITQVAFLAIGLCWAGVARADEPPGAAAPPADEGYLDDLPELPPMPEGTPEAAPPQEWQYDGPHAINAEAGGGWCNLRGPHAHPYPPFDELLFQEEDDGGYAFLGDPTDFGYDGSDLYWYEGDHPIAAGFGAGWCFMTWPHRHFYRPGAGYAACGSRWCYRGPRDGRYSSLRVSWGPVWARYPSHYWGRTYFRTHTAVRPGHWASTHYRPPVTIKRGATQGRVVRPGGVARPVTMPLRRAAPAPLVVPRTRVITHPPATTIRAAPRHVEPRTYYVRPTAPARSWAAPRGAFEPRMSAPRPPAPPRELAPPRSAAPPRAAAPPRPSTPSHSSASHGSSGSHGGGGRHR
jgi:hypothetical protein